MNMRYIDVIGYVGSIITLVAAALFLLMLAGVLHSLEFENILGTFIVGQAFYNGYLMVALKQHTRRIIRTFFL